MSITVLYNNTKKIVKIANGNALAFNVVGDAAAAFNVDPSLRDKCVLKHKKMVIDPSLSWRFCNIPNNAILVP